MARFAKTRKPAAKAHRSSASNKHQRDREALDDFAPQGFIPTPRRVAVQPLEPKTVMQDRYMKAITNSVLTIGTGPAGTGKTYIAGTMAADALSAGEVEKIIITRPAVDAGESLGFLPGEMEAKYAPYIAAFRAVLDERLGKSRVEYMLKNGQIEAVPLAYMRGLTFKRAFVIMDEAQNATPQQMKLFLTRVGEDCTVVVNGDLDQKDITGESGLQDAIDRISFIPSVRVVRFDRRDVVRSGFVQEVVEAYETSPV